ncbi:hypothetical protein QBC46DRAFT_384078 [Diplogelasinospora grovesii]|uniref:Cyanovirin-N domain-containing protein n=1 Tax=Diplogelasinospora grovesii TaxID=303347 RepID=A0AAN6N820_9PEZI|nr:hypothetical protein QBC46DRAFT_384078 [Diplogelasinospora grovesii]
MHISTLLPFFLCALAAAHPDTYYSNFTQTCENITLVGTSSLVALCNANLTDQNQTPRPNRLDLNQCVGLEQNTGTLEFAVNGKFTTGCIDCYVMPINNTATTQTHNSSTAFTCACLPYQGYLGQDNHPLETTLNLDEGIGNFNGVLKCIGGFTGS